MKGDVLYMISSKYKDVINHIVQHNSNIYLEDKECKKSEIFFHFYTFLNNSSSGHKLEVSNSAISAHNFNIINANTFLQITYIEEYYFIYDPNTQSSCQFGSSKEVFNYILTRLTNN